MDPKPDHFKGKDAMSHVAEAQIQGIVSSAEIHGSEMPGHLYAAADAARDTAVVLGLLWILLSALQVPVDKSLLFLAIFGGGWLLWKAGRSAWLGWARLERLHRVIAQEKWEIEHHRQQEREELVALYAAKGFEGKLLQDVVDVLMADGDRLLRVMVEEELGFTLENHEHPLKQAVGAAIGSLIVLVGCLLGGFLFPSYGVLYTALILMGAAAAWAAWQDRNKMIPAIVWNLGLAILAGGFVYFMFKFKGE